MRIQLVAVASLVALFVSVSSAQEAHSQAVQEAEKALKARKARHASAAKGAAWLKKRQAKDGHFGQKYSIAVTGMSGLALLASQDDPFATHEVVKAVNWLLPQVKNGRLPGQGHTWIHGQGFASLFLSEAYGRAYLAETRPPKLDMKRLGAAVQACVKAIEATQSTTGGWWYRPGQSGTHQHEGSTTVCAVQALRSASNFGFETDPDVLAKGFEYLKNSQNKNGSFQYQLGDGRQMLEGTAAAIATLAMMEKADYPVLMRGVNYLGSKGSPAISASRFPYYGHFYAELGMKLVDEEMGGGVPVAAGWHDWVVFWLMQKQQLDGGWPMMGWMKGNASGDTEYAAALAIATLSIRDGRASIFKRPALYIYEKGKD